MNSSSKADMKSEVFLNDFACTARKTVNCNDKKLSLHLFFGLFDADLPDADHIGVLTASVRDRAFDEDACVEHSTELELGWHAGPGTVR